MAASPVRLTVRGTDVELRRPAGGTPGWEAYSVASDEYIGHVEGTHGRWVATSWMGHRIGGYCATRDEAVGRLTVED